METSGLYSKRLRLAFLALCLCLLGSLNNFVAADASVQDGDAAAAADQYTCTKSSRCELGCCGNIDKTTGQGVCGFGPDFCGSTCFSDCGRKSECDPGWGIQWSNMSTCPLNVCCSKFGFCGTTPDFCGSAIVPNPQCGGKSSDKRTIGYYEGWNYQRPCNNMEPENIPLGWYTHINFAFALIDPKTFRIAPMDDGTASRYQRVSALKKRQKDLEVWIAIGGWAMNDPGPYRTVFSDLVKSEDAQKKFFPALISFMMNNDFDGVDLDWEYPVADDRGGIPEDFSNYPKFLTKLRDALNASGRRFGISLTLPAQYWYLRGFDISNLEPLVDWFNVMTYDIHGVWDGGIKSLGPVAHAHTNLTEIDTGLNLLWRNHINPERVNLGLGFYGRSFTLKDPSCTAAGCPFSGGGAAGKCTKTEGVLSVGEINDAIKGGAKVQFDQVAGVKIATWGGNQWVSYDDAQTLKMKIDYANKRCLGGTMAWAVDLDDGTLIGELAQGLTRNKSDIFDIWYGMADENITDIKGSAAALRPRLLKGEL